jgi:transglutaminase-like putative cysteine protease
VSFWRGEQSRIATAPLVVACFALVLSVLPLGDKISPWAIVVFGGAILARLLVNRRRWRLPSGPLRIAVLAAGIGGIAFFSGTLIGVEPGLGIFLVMVSLKLLETNSVRDFQVVVLLGWFLCVCGLCFSQDFTTWLYLSAVALLLAGSLVRFHRSAGRASFGRAVLTVLKMLAQAMPIVVLLFLFFPRVQGGFQVQFGRPASALTGMSDELSPGSFARLAQNANIAFRADFPDANIPARSQLYWRGAVLWRCEGLIWARGHPEMRVERRAGQLEGAAIRQQIFLKPLGGRWLPALDRPASDVPGATREAGGFLQSRRPILSPLVYSVASRPENRESQLDPIQQFTALRKPAVISPRVQALAASWRESGATDKQVIDAALRHFRRERFIYSLEPGFYGADALSEFLFERRVGFCEHYAAAFATLMRIAGIPSRVVVGYHGGEMGLGNYVTVRQLDAHAWAEVWIKGEGWLRVDPTTVVAPDRISSGSESFLATQARAQDPSAAGASTGVTGLRELLRPARLLWDNISYHWDLRVVSYDDASQRSMLTLVGLEKFTPPMLLFWLAVGVVFILSLLGLWLARPRRGDKGPLVRDYERFCRRFAAAGLPREPNEGPLHFSERAAINFPAQAAAIRKAARFYIAARYARDLAVIGDFQRAVRALPKLEGPGRVAVQSR